MTIALLIGVILLLAAGNGSGKVAVIRQILPAWLINLPVAGLFAYLIATFSS